MPVISNSSPLILFSRIGRLELLRELFGQVLVPLAVDREVVRAGSGRPGESEVRSASWLLRHPVSADAVVAHSLVHLDDGEAEAIALALDLAEDCLLLLDDKPARREALGRRLVVVGSAGILVLAKRRGLIESVRVPLDELRAAGLRISLSVYLQVLKEAGE